MRDCAYCIVENHKVRRQRKCFGSSPLSHSAEASFQAIVRRDRHDADTDAEDIPDFYVKCGNFLAHDMQTRRLDRDDIVHTIVADGQSVEISNDAIQPREKMCLRTSLLGVESVTHLNHRFARIPSPSIQRSR